MISIDFDGNIKTDSSGNIASVSGSEATQQAFVSEVRCTQGTFDLLPEFGRNPIVWTLSQSPKDRMEDIVRISKNYLTVREISYNKDSQTYEVTT